MAPNFLKSVKQRLSKSKEEKVVPKSKSPSNNGGNIALSSTSKTPGNGGLESTPSSPDIEVTFALAEGEYLSRDLQWLLLEASKYVNIAIYQNQKCSPQDIQLKHDACLDKIAAFVLEKWQKAMFFINHIKPGKKLCDFEVPFRYRGFDGHVVPLHPKAFRFESWFNDNSESRDQNAMTSTSSKRKTLDMQPLNNEDLSENISRRNL